MSFFSELDPKSLDKVEDKMKKIKTKFQELLMIICGLIILGLIVCLYIQRVESMPPNAILYLTKDNTYVSPPCVSYWGLQHFGFSNQYELEDAKHSREFIWGKHHNPNLECRDDYVGSSYLLGIRIPRWLAKALAIYSLGHLRTTHLGGFVGDSRPYLVWVIFGFSHPRWNKDGTWNW